MLNNKEPISDSTASPPDLHFSSLPTLKSGNSKPLASKSESTTSPSWQPLWKLILLKYIEHRLAVLSFVLIFFFGFIATFAPWIQSITGLNPEDQNPLLRYQPPGSLTEISLEKRKELLEDFSEKSPVWMARWSQHHPEGIESLFLWLEKPLEEQKIFLAELKLEEDLKKPLYKLHDQFSKTHWLGTDELGRDVLIRLIFGTRISMGVGVLVALASSLIGLLIGSFAGYYGGWIDSLLMRITDSLLSLPTLPILIVFSALDLKKVPGLNFIINVENESLYKLVFILCLFSWMTVALLIRGQVLSMKEREFVLASKTMGARDLRLIFIHMFPNVVAPLLVSVTLGVGESIQFEAALSFLGLGIQPPTPSWGNMLFNAQDLIQEAPYLAVLPGVLILLATIGFNFIGEGLQTALDPKSIQR